MIGYLHENTMAIQEDQVTAIPTKAQIEFQKMEMGLFLHFGIRTFYEGFEDFDPRPMSADNFNPIALDCSQWVQTAKAAGMKYIVMTAKHHDGFCLWPSAYTDFSVTYSSWKAGKGDVVKEFTDACRKEGIKIGLYYSPYDKACPVYDRPAEYDDYFINQIGELLQNYGRIDLLWLDECGSEGHGYDWARIAASIRKMQPEIMIFQLADPAYRWVGNEEGIAPAPCWNTVGEQEIFASGVRPEKKGAWLPAECDCRMRQKRWFFSDSDEHTVKSLAQLLGIYYYSVGRGCNLLLNIGPDRRGLLPDRDASRLLEFGSQIKKRFSSPIASLNDFKNEDNQWVLDLKEQIWLDHMVIKEDISYGERIRRFVIEVQMDKHLASKWMKVFEGESVGYQSICSFPPVPARGIRLIVTQAENPVHISRLDAYYAVGKEEEAK